MSRLTKRNADGTAWYNHTIFEKPVGINELLERLCHYEDLEEAGRLTEQPCKPGDKVWCIEENDYAGYLFMGMCGDYAILCAKYTSCETFEEQLNCMAEETIEEGDTHVEIFHKNHVFLTKAEVEAKMAELEECDNQ